MTLLRLIASRIAQLLLVLLAVTLAVFVLTQVAPGDAARLRLGPRASEEAVQALREQMGLDRPLVVQYFEYLGRLLRGDLGTSVDGRPVIDVVAQNYSATLLLVCSVVILSVIAAVLIATFAAVRRDRSLDHGLRLLMLIGLFLPSFWVGFLLLRFIAIPTGWFPVSGLNQDNFSELLRSLVLPSVAGAIALAPVLARSLRSSLIEVLGSEYVAVARSLGVRGPRLFREHVLRNAAGPAVALLAVNIGYLFFGVVVLEATFNINGLGSVLVRASITQDVFLVQGITLLFAIGVVLANIAGELVSAWLDPRRVAA